MDQSHFQHFVCLVIQYKYNNDINADNNACMIIIHVHVHV